MSYGKIDMTVPAWTYKNKSTAKLTIKELQLMHLLRIKPVRLSKIMSTLWGPEDRREVSDKTLHVHIYHLRRKLQPLGLTIIYEDKHYYLSEKTGRKRV